MLRFTIFLLAILSALHATTANINAQVPDILDREDESVELFADHFFKNVDHVLIQVGCKNLLQ